MSSINGTTTKHILLTIDVEDWFQVENFKPWIPFETWDQRELCVERNVHRLLDLMDSVVVAGKPESLEGGKVGTNAELEDQNKELNEPNQHSQPNQLNNLSESIYNSQLTTNKSHAAAPAANKQQTVDNKHGEVAIGHNGKSSPAKWANSINVVNSINSDTHSDNKQQSTDHIQTKKVKATFFVLAWLADRLPELVREIQSRGHEIASHGYNHKLPDQLSAAELKMDLTDSKKRLEDLIGSPVSG